MHRLFGIGAVAGNSKVGAGATGAVGDSPVVAGREFLR